MKDFYLKFRDWLYYVRNYEENKLNEQLIDEERVELTKKMVELQNQLTQEKSLNKVKDELIEKRDKRVELLNGRVSDTIQRNKELSKTIQVMSKQIEELNIKILEKEEARQKCAASVGGLTTSNKALTEKLKQAEYTINFYKTHKKAPTLKELKDYTFGRKKTSDKYV